MDLKRDEATGYIVWNQESVEDSGIVLPGTKDTRVNQRCACASTCPPPHATHPTPTHQPLPRAF